MWTVAVTAANLKQISCNISEHRYFLVYTLAVEMLSYANGKQVSIFCIRSGELLVLTQAVGAGQYSVEEMTDVGSELNNKVC